MTPYKLQWLYYRKQHGDKATWIHWSTSACVEHADSYDWTKRNQTHFDFSYSKLTWPSSRTSTTKPGNFKNEMNSQSMINFIELNLRCYAFRYPELKISLESVEAEGVSNVIVNATLHVSIYM